MDVQAHINDYRFKLQKFSKKKLIEEVIKLTVDYANLQTTYVKLKQFLEKGGRNDKHLHTNIKTRKSIITTD